MLQKKNLQYAEQETSIAKHEVPVLKSTFASGRPGAPICPIGVKITSALFGRFLFYCMDCKTCALYM